MARKAGRKYIRNHETRNDRIQTLRHRLEQNNGILLLNAMIAGKALNDILELIRLHELIVPILLKELIIERQCSFEGTAYTADMCLRYMREFLRFLDDLLGFRPHILDLCRARQNVLHVFRMKESEPISRLVFSTIS